MNSFSRHLLTFFLIVAAGTAPALVIRGQDVAASTTGEKLSLSSALRLALENNPGLRAARGRIDAATGRATQAGAWANPELELGAEDWPWRRGRGFSDSKRTIGITQPLSYPGKRSLDRQIGRAGVRHSEAELILGRTDLVRDVKIAFFRALAGERLVEVSAELEKAAESSAAIARKRVEAGAAAYQEQLRAEVLLEQVRAEAADRRRDLAAAQQSLAALLGRPELGALRLQGELDEAPDANLLAGAARDRLTAHPSLRAAQANLERAELGSRRARLDPYPDVRLGVAGGRSGEADQSIVQLSLSVPLPLLDRGKGAQQEARAHVGVAQAELHALEQRLQCEWAIAQRRYRTAVEQVGNSRERVLPRATEALQLVRTGFETGKFNFIDLIDTQRMTAEVRQAHFEKLLEMNVARAELEALLTDPTPPSGPAD